MKRYKILTILIPFLIICCSDKNEDKYSENLKSTSCYIVIVNILIVKG